MIFFLLKDVLMTTTGTALMWQAWRQGMALRPWENTGAVSYTHLKCHVAVHPVPCDAHSFSHGESGGYRTNAKSFDMSKTDSGKKGSDSQTNDVKADLDLRVGDGSDLGQLSWKKVCRHDWHLAAVGKCDPDADQYVCLLYTS